MTLREILMKAEREAIVTVLRATTGRGRLSASAKTLGISRKNLWEKIRLHKIDKTVEQPQEQLPLEVPPGVTPVDLTGVPVTVVSLPWPVPLFAPTDRTGS